MSKEKYNFERLATNHVHKNENVFNLKMHTIFYTIRPTVHRKPSNNLLIHPRPLRVDIRFQNSRIRVDEALGDSGKVELKKWIYAVSKFIS